MTLARFTCRTRFITSYQLKLFSYIKESRFLVPTTQLTNHPLLRFTIVTLRALQNLHSSFTHPFCTPEKPLFCGAECHGGAAELAMETPPAPPAPSGRRDSRSAKWVGKQAEKSMEMALFDLLPPDALSKSERTSKHVNTSSKPSVCNRTHPHYGKTS